MRCKLTFIDGIEKIIETSKTGNDALADLATQIGDITGGSNTPQLAALLDELEPVTLKLNWSLTVTPSFSELVRSDLGIFIESKAELEAGGTFDVGDNYNIITENASIIESHDTLEKVVQAYKERLDIAGPEIDTFRLDEKSRVPDEQL